MFKLSVALSASFVAAQFVPTSLTTYCNALAVQCPNHSMNTTTCQTAFAQVPLGSVGSSDGDMNTISCRQKYLTDPAFNGTMNNCQYAGATGGGRCGEVLANVCNIAATVCGSVVGVTPSFPDTTTCQSGPSATPPGLNTIANQWGFLQGSSASSEDSLECRVYHAIASVSSGNNVHCTHYALASSQCTMAVSTNAAQYCANLDYNCQNNTSPSNQQFAAVAQCLVVAAGYVNDNDARNTNAGNTLGCREYHSQAAKNNTIHCEHGGPSGAGVCGTRREAWASILNAAPCMDPTVMQFIAMVGNTTADMLVTPGNSVATPPVPYSTTFDTSGNTQVCRIYHLGVASTAPTHCGHGTLSAGDPGQPAQCGVSKVSNLCAFIGNVCMFGANATYQYASNAACMSALVASNTFNLTDGTTVPTQDKAGNTIECRFYHATVAASWMSGGSAFASMAAGTNAMEQLRYHCGHTLAPATAGGCGTAAMNPTPSSKPSSASTLPIMMASVATVVSVFFV